jgi:hypothetical protein
MLPLFQHLPSLWGKDAYSEPAVLPICFLTSSSVLDPQNLQGAQTSQSLLVGPVEAFLHPYSGLGEK